jgi:hypothetical protein
MNSLYLHINRIVVDGLPESGQRRFVRALEAELRQLAESGMADGSRRSMRQRIQALAAGQLRPGATPEQAAAQVARSIRQGVMNERPRVSSQHSATTISSHTTSGGRGPSHDV